MTDTLRVALEALQEYVPALQSMRDRMMVALPPKFGEGFDGDMDTLREVTAAIKRLARLAPPAPGGEREDGEREPADGEIYGVRFGMGAVGVSTGVYTGEPAVILREPSVPGVIGMPFTDAERGPIRAVLLFPTEAQAKAVADALTTPPAEAREPVGDAFKGQHVEYESAEHLAEEMEEQAEYDFNAECCNSSYPITANNRLLRDGAALIRKLAAQPRDTPRDSGDADTKRLDWLEAQAEHGYGWHARRSVTNRGYRLHQHTRGGLPTAREAIDAAMQSPTGEPT